MPLLLDNVPVNPTGLTLGDALQAGRAAAEGNGRIVVEIFLDQAAIDPDELRRRSEAPLGEAELKLTSVRPAALVRSTLHDVAEAIEKVKQDQTAAAEALQQGRLDEAMAFLSALLPVWEQVQRATEYSTAIMGWSLDELEVKTAGGTIKIADEITRLVTTLGEIKRSLQARDWAGLSDVLAFDLDEQAQRWRMLLSALAATAAKA
ncbi:MAG: hypothetical protein H7Y88_06760 [Phycisphaerales bacterium]|nr:hypothetical protein [Phycisphaerales bacterium]